MSSATLSQTNQDGLDDLLAAIEANDDRLGIFIAVCDDTGLRQEIILQYEHELAPAFRHYRLALQRDEPSIKALISRQVAEDEYLQQGGLAVLTITGAEYLSAMRRGQEEKSAQEEFLGYLQWTREGLRKFPFAIVIWVTQQLLETISRKAPDFWSWRRDVIRFTSRRSITVSTESLISGLGASLALPEEIGETLTLFDVEALIEDTAEKDPQSPLLASLHSQAGKLYAGKLQDNRVVDYAVAAERAISHLQKALQLQPSSNPSSETATNLGWLAWLKERRGDEKEAIALYQESLAIDEQIGDVQGKAATLHQLAGLKADQGDMEGAIALYQESLAIKEQIGDVQGKAATLAMMGQLLADEKGDTVTAIAYLQESRAIFQRIGSPDAHTVQDILDRVSGQS